MNPSNPSTSWRRNQNPFASLTVLVQGPQWDPTTDRATSPLCSWCVLQPAPLPLQREPMGDEKHGDKPLDFAVPRQTSVFFNIWVFEFIIRWIDITWWHNMISMMQCLKIEDVILSNLCGQEMTAGKKWHIKYIILGLCKLMCYQPLSAVALGCTSSLDIRQNPTVHYTLRPAWLQNATCFLTASCPAFSRIALAVKESYNSLTHVVVFLLLWSM